MDPRDRLNDGQPQARSRFEGRSGPEGLEHYLFFAWREASPLVSDLETTAGRLQLNAKSNWGVSRSVLGRVPQQVQQRLGQPLRVSLKPCASHAGLYRQTMPKNELRIFRDTTHEIVQKQRFHFELIPIVQPLQGAQVLYQPGHEVEHADERLLDGPHFPLVGPRLQHVQMATADGDQGPQFMRDRQDECVLHRRQLGTGIGRATRPRTQEPTKNTLDGRP